MKQNKLLGRAGLAVVLGMSALAGILPLRAQDDSAEKEGKKVEAVAAVEPAEKLQIPPKSVTQADPARETGDENTEHVDHDGKDVVMVGNDFVDHHPLPAAEQRGPLCLLPGDASRPAGSVGADFDRGRC